MYISAEKASLHRRISARLGEQLQAKMTAYELPGFPRVVFLEISELISSRRIHVRSLRTLLLQGTKYRAMDESGWWISMVRHDRPPTGLILSQARKVCSSCP